MITKLILLYPPNYDMETSYALLAVFLCVGIAVGAIGVAGQSPAEFSLESDSTVTTPTQTVSNEFTDGELTVRQTAVVEPDEVLTGTATVPNTDEQYVIQFRDSDSPLDAKILNRTDEAETPFKHHVSSESPGSYAVNIWDPNEQLVKSVLPVVIASHDVSSVQINSSSPSNADVAPSETPPVDVSLTTLEATTVEKVNLTVWNDNEELSTTLEKTATNEYEGTLPSLDEGEYQAQVRVRGGETVNGRPSLIGLSDAHSLTVAETQDSEDDNTDNGSSDDDGEDGDDSSGSTDDGNNTSDDTNSTDDSTNTSDGSNSTDTTDSTDDSNSTDDSDNTGGDSTGTSTNGTDNGTDDSATNNSSDATGNDSDGTISPNNDTDLADGTEDSTPLYAVQLILVTVVLGSAFHRFRRAN
ncbi:hypothetical protein [Halorubrum sp. AS12]|uniref:hypothetical protein n=1 Tax=Halorubrum sp. AS12 TaxID=3409687 RepID=UPI003DA75A6C